jgi:hypothetical protein
MRMIALLAIAGLMLTSIAFAGECNSCRKDSCAKHRAKAPVCCEKHQQSGGSCIEIPVPAQDCEAIDPKCVPHEQYRLICNYKRAEYTLCCGHADYRLLCQPRCEKPCKPKCQPKCKPLSIQVIEAGKGELD